MVAISNAVTSNDVEFRSRKDEKKWKKATFEGGNKLKKRKGLVGRKKRNCISVVSCPVMLSPKLKKSTTERGEVQFTEADGNWFL